MPKTQPRNLPDAASSEDELPSLDELLRQPRTAVAPTSSNAAPKSPRKNTSEQRSSSKPFQALQRQTKGTRHVAIDEVDVPVPVLAPAPSRRSPSKPTISRSPIKIVDGEKKVCQKFEGTGRRQRALKSPVKGLGLLFEPQRATDDEGEIARVGRNRRGGHRRAFKPFLFSSDEEDEPSTEVDIFKGTGITRKMSRRRKRGVALCEPVADADSVDGDEEIPLSTNKQEDGVLVAALDRLNLEGSKSIPSPTKARSRGFARTTSPLKHSQTASTESLPQDNTKTTTIPDSSSPVDHYIGATLTFSPPASPSLSALPVRPATPPTVTPPPSPGKLRSPSKATLPSKKLDATFQAPARPSLDAFWAQDIVNDFNEQHSPVKTLTSPRKKHLLDFFADRSDDDDASFESSTLSTTPPAKKATRSPAKKVDAEAKKLKKACLKAFNERKENLAREFLNQLDTRVTDGEIARQTANTSGVQVIWSKKLNTTAGRANWRRERRVASTSSANGSEKPEPSFRNVATIELASKVVDNETRLYNVMGHEFCHLANFMISRELKQPHGPSFQAWARKVTKAFGRSHGVEVTTKHDYAIAYKYVWICERADCGTEYMRHSKSIDTERHTCGKCKSKLIQVLPKPRGGQKSPEKKGNEKGEVGTEYSRFVKEQFKVVKEAMPPNSPSKEVMKEIAVRYRERKKQVEEVEVVEIVDEDEEDTGNNKSPTKMGPNDDVEGVARRLDFFKI